jgi:hypothetical protein
MSIPTSGITLQTPTDLLAAVPYMLGFHPADSVVAIGLARQRVTFTVRTDLPPPDDVDAVADQIADALETQGVDIALIVGYGAAAPVTRTVLAVREALTAHGIGLGEMIRATDGRYWSYLCESSDCCPVEGTAYDVAATEVAAAATYQGRVALPDRAAFESCLAPVTGPERDAVDEATERAAQRMADRVGDAADPVVARTRAGLRALADALRCVAAGGRLADADLAMLTLLLACVEVRDHAWARIAAARFDLHAQVALWLDATRRARSDLVAGPATLLGYAAYRVGDGPLARVAVQRALTADPGYTLADLLGQAIDRGIPPSMLAPPPPAPRRRPGRRRRRGRNRGG